MAKKARTKKQMESDIGFLEYKTKMNEDDFKKLIKKIASSVEVCGSDGLELGRDLTNALAMYYQLCGLALAKAVVTGKYP